MTTKTIPSVTMKIEELRKAVQKVSLVAKKTTLPVTEYILLTIDGKVTLRATDLEKMVSVELDAVGDNITALLPKRAVNRFLSGGNGDIILTGGQKTIALERTGLGKITLPCNGVQQFPPIPQGKDLKWQTVDTKLFCQAIRYCVPACAPEDSRPILTAICLKDGEMVSADGFRLVVYKNEKMQFGIGSKLLPVGGVELKTALLPATSAALIARLFAGKDELQVAFNDTQAYFKADGIEFTSQLCQGNYPQYEQLIPATFNSKVSFSAPLMEQRLGMIDPTTIVSGITRFNFHRTEKGEDVCTITARSEEVADYAFELPVKLEDGGEAKIAFNFKYILEALKPFAQINLELTSPSSPGKLTGDIEGLTIVVMPMFVQR